VHFVYYNDFQIEYKGYFVLTDNDEDIVSISPHGYLEVKKATFGNTRSIQITSDAHGRLTKKYFEGRNEKSYEGEGRQWLADILPTLVRISGVGAENRVQRIYQNEGIKGLLNEIDEVEDHSSSVRNLYFIIAVDKLNLSDSDIQKMLPEMEEIASNSKKGTLMRELLTKYQLSARAATLLLRTTQTLDYNTERGSVLRVFNRKFIEDDNVLDVYFDIIDDMSINSEKGNVLKDLMQVQTLSSGTWIRLFRSIDSFDLMRERGAILLTAIDYMPENSSHVLDAFDEAVEDMDDDYYVLKGEILNTLIDKQSGKMASGKPNADLLMRLLVSAEDIPSDSKKGEILRKVNRNFVATPEIIDEYTDVIYSISNNIEVYNVLLDLIRKNQLEHKAYKMVLDITGDLVAEDYQHAAGAVIRACVDKMPYDKYLLDEVFETLQDMDQNATIEEVLRWISLSDKFNNDGFVISKIIETTRNIDVDIEVASVLTGLKHYDKNASEQSIPFEYAVERLEWEYFRRKLQDWVN
jgi:hypothetical protein